MRLTQLKLAGFKSFVDPTTLHIHGQRMGVVGPNGCGKSNVMESVRWVLGESSAKEMRGDSMDAVIFNGSATRKPISRASVELVFDNSLGGAAGEWSQYAEISVKRIIERDKGSAYYINNTLVRRRDVADLFLGTGLGGRAYAIIGQNTINRIVEAKPEDLRVFLEEAAGISKYKERRRETELRLRDTRENLIRVEDILRELDKQITRLQSQAVVAEKHRALHHTLTLTRGLVWLLKKREASTAWEKAQRQVERLVQDLDAQMAGLRNKESALETARQHNFTVIETVNQAQAAYYQANAELANLENQLKNTQDAQDRMQAQLKQLVVQLEKNTLQISELQVNLTGAQSRLQLEQDHVALSEQAHQQAGAVIPHLSEQFQAALDALNSQQDVWLEEGQRLRLEQSHAEHIKHAASEARAHLAKLQLTLAGIELTADDALEAQLAELLQMEASVAGLEQAAAESLAQELDLNKQVRTNAEAHLSAQRDLTALEAEINSLLKIQQSIKNANNEASLSGWLKSAGLEDNTRTWQAIRVQAGWESALEAVLGARLNAIGVGELNVASRPPAALTLALDASPLSAVHQPSGRATLHSIISHDVSKQQAALQDWLSGFYLLEEGEDIDLARRSLQHAEYLVNKQGDVYGRYSVSYFATQSILHGVLERQAQLAALEKKLPGAQALLSSTQAQLRQTELALQALREARHVNATQLKAAVQQTHQLNLKVQQQKQTQLNNLQKQKNLQAECALLDDKLLQLTTESAVKESLLADITHGLPGLQQLKDQAQLTKQTAEVALNDARNQWHSMEKSHQELNFNMKLRLNEIMALEERVNAVLKENGALKVRQDDLLASLAVTKMAGLKANLQAAIDAKERQEQVLTEARNNMHAGELALQQQERERMQNEQLLHPLRDKLEVSRLAEQEARLSFEQCQAELNAGTLTETQLGADLDSALMEKRALKVADLEQVCNQTLADIDMLGAVNLAAIQELDVEQTRLHYLTSQSTDLKDASNTLEEAIRKIDKDSRGRLQATFDEANRHFNELFSTLFAGGQAGLALLGEEILDSGLQVFAQPPGKKNSTIHLLSGGEKALTALALVFALFRLNPAPFCLMDEVDAPLDDSNTERFCAMVKKMSEKTQFLYVSHNKITMEMAQQLIGVTMQESGVSRIVEVDMDAAVQMMEAQSSA